MKCRIEISIALALMCCTFLGADFNSGWVHYLGNPQRTAYVSGNGPDIPEILWKVRISCYGRDWTGKKTYGPGVFDTSPFIVGGEVLALWKDSIYNTSATIVICVDLLTGEIFQEEKVCSEEGYFLSIFPVNNRIIGKSLWSLDEFDPVFGKVELLAETPQKGFGSNDYPVLLENKCIIYTTPAICFSSSDFSVLWSLGDVTESDWVLTNAAGDEDLVIFIMNKGLFGDYSTQRIFAVDPSTGAPKWESDSIVGVRWLALGRDTVYCAGNKLWAFDKNGSKKWEFIPENTIRSNLVLGPDAVYCADAENNLYKVDLNGNLVWKIDYEGTPFFQTHLLGTGDILYCIGSFPDEEMNPHQSQITAYSMVDGSEIWKIGRGAFGGVNGSPAIADGILVIGTMDGEIVAFASDPELFVKQGDAFVSMESREKAGDSYRKAVNLYEKKGNIEKAEEIKKRISELGLPLETQSPTPSTYPPSPVSPSPEPSPLAKKSALLIASIIAIVVFIMIMTNYFVKRKQNK